MLCDFLGDFPNFSLQNKLQNDLGKITILHMLCIEYKCLINQYPMSLVLLLIELL